MHVSNLCDKCNVVDDSEMVECHACHLKYHVKCLNFGRNARHWICPKSPTHKNQVRRNSASMTNISQ